MPHILVSAVAGMAFIAILACGCSGTTFRVFEENDVAGLGGGTDRYYTQGLRLELTHSLAEDVPVLSSVERALWIHPQVDDYVVQRQYVTFAGGQKIFTPEDIRIETLQTDDRPYAGWLFGGIAHHNLALGRISRSEGLAQEKTIEADDQVTRAAAFTRDDRLDSLELQVGVVGPSSLAEETQTRFHELIGATTPEGWDNQLDDELGVNLGFSRKLRHNYGRFSLLGLEHDLITNFGASAGNVESFAQIGGLFRIGGKLRRDFGIDPTGGDVGLEDLRRRLEDRFPDLDEHDLERLREQFGSAFSWYLFGGVDGRFVVNNIFLDGNTRKDSHSVEKERFVADFKLGIALQFRRFEISYTVVARTPEFRRASDPQIFGSINAALRF